MNELRHTQTRTLTGLMSLPPFHPLTEPYNIWHIPVASDFMTLWCHTTSAFTNYGDNDAFVSEKNSPGPSKPATNIFPTSPSLSRRFFTLALHLLFNSHERWRAESTGVNFINLFRCNNSRPSVPGEVRRLEPKLFCVTCTLLDTLLTKCHNC